MKKILFVALAAVGLAACVQNEELAVAPKGTAIGFDTFVENVTKASAYDSTNLAEFKVYGAISQNGVVVTPIFDNVPVTKVGGIWSYSPEYTQYWIPGFRYDFAAVVDATDVVCENGLPSSFKTDMTEQNDVLYATAGRDFGANDVAETVSFAFNHLLAKAKFTVKNTMSENGSYKYEVTSIKITNADKLGEYSVANATWQATDTYEADFGAVAAVGYNSSAASANELYLLPQPNKSYTIAVECRLLQGGVEVANASKTATILTTLEKSKQYNFVLEFGNPGEEIDFEASVEGWTPNGDSPVYNGTTAYVATADAFGAALNNPEVGAIVLEKSIETNGIVFSNPSTRAATTYPGRNLIIDGQGKTLVYKGDAGGRIIDVRSETEGMSLTIKNLNVVNEISWIERAVNYNTDGTLTLDNITISSVEGCSLNYAINLPASSDNAKVVVENSTIVAGAQALNLWGEYTNVTIKNSDLSVVDGNAIEGYSVIALNNEGVNSADYSVVEVVGGSVKVVYKGDGEKGPSFAVRNSTVNGVVNFAETTEVVGGTINPVAVAYWNNSPYYYSYNSLQGAIDTYNTHKPDGVRVIRDIVLDETLTIAEDQTILLDLAGRTISQEKECTNSYAMIENRGTLTITGNGTISFKDTGAGDSSFGWGSYTVANYNTLVVENATIENVTTLNENGVQHMYCAIHQGINAKSLTVNGGTIYTNAYRTIRANHGAVVLNGGTFQGQVWMHPFDANTSLTINGGTFAPQGVDGSSVYVENATYNVALAVNGGHFTTKIGASDPAKVAGAVVGGSFTETAKGNTNDKLFNAGCQWSDAENGIYTLSLKDWWQDANKNYHIATAAGWLWMADQNDTYFGSKTIYLESDIDFAGKEIRVARMWTPEYSATFDGQGHTISNVYMAGGYDKNNQALFDGLMSVKNLTVKNSHVYGMSQVGIIGVNIFGNIENCHVVGCRSYGYVHHVGGIVGLHSWGEIKNCSVENTKIECYYYGAVGAIAGAMNEVSRKITGCSVKGCQLIKEGPEGVYPDWDPLFGIVVGYADAPGTYVFDCEIENNTIKGAASTQLYGEVPAGSTVNGETK